MTRKQREVCDRKTYAKAFLFLSNQSEEYVTTRTVPELLESVATAIGSTALNAAAVRDICKDLNRKPRRVGRRSESANRQGRVVELAACVLDVIEVMGCETELNGTVDKLKALSGKKPVHHADSEPA